MSDLLGRRLAAVALGLLADRALGEPPTSFHPVARFGSLMTAIERITWSDRRLPGAAHAAVGLGCGIVAGRIVPSTAAAVALSCAGRELRKTASTIGDQCRLDDLDAARRSLPSLVGRDPSSLDRSQIAAAVIESVAENSVDAVIAPAFWGLVAGAPGALGYRAVNTMDAMIGHRSDRYRRFGSAAARLDDLANLIPARLFALGVAVAAPRGRIGAIVAAVREDAPYHPSPNAGVAEAAVAAACGVQLGGPIRYGERAEVRPRLGRGPRPGPGDIEAAVALVDRVEKAITVGLAVGGFVLSARELTRWVRLGAG